MNHLTSKLLLELTSWEVDMVGTNLVVYLSSWELISWVMNFCRDGLMIQRFNTLRLAQSHMTVAFQIVYTAIAT